MTAGFDCVETETPGVWNVQFTGPTPFLTPLTGEEVASYCHIFDKVLLVGVFSWSNYSQAVVKEIQDNSSWFEENSIGLAIFSLENPEQGELLSPGFSAHYYQAATEPAMLLLEKFNLVKSRFGPLGIERIKEWIIAA